jgi:hypothetical protein
VLCPAPQQPLNETNPQKKPLSQHLFALDDGVRGIEVFDNKKLEVLILHIGLILGCRIICRMKLKMEPKGLERCLD